MLVKPSAVKYSQAASDERHVTVNVARKQNWAVHHTMLIKHWQNVFGIFLLEFPKLICPGVANQLYWSHFLSKIPISVLTFHNNPKSFFFCFYWLSRWGGIVQVDLWQTHLLCFPRPGLTLATLHAYFSGFAHCLPGIAALWLPSGTWLSLPDLLFSFIFIVPKHFGAHHGF